MINIYCLQIYSFYCGFKAVFWIVGPDNVVWKYSLLLLITILFYGFHVPFDVDANQAVTIHFEQIYIFLGVIEEG